MEGEKQEGESKEEIWRGTRDKEKEKGIGEILGRVERERKENSGEENGWKMKWTIKLKFE